jgi:hypothetical protein
MHEICTWEGIGGGKACRAGVNVKLGFLEMR